MVSLRDATDATRYGGKAAGLARLIRAGLPVPPGVAVGWDESLDAETLRRVLGTIGPATRWAVRSSAVGEDGHTTSFAGQHDTELDVDLSDVPHHVRAVRVSAHTPRALAYRAAHGILGPIKMGVVVQAMVPAITHSALVFTREPVTGDDSIVVVEVAPCRGDVLVSGGVTPAHYEVPRQRLDAVPTWLRPLVRYAVRAERAMGHPVDVEAAYGVDGWWLTQARPITT